MSMTTVLEALGKHIKNLEDEIYFKNIEIERLKEELKHEKN